MHPIDKKNRTIAIVFFSTALILTIISAIHNLYFLHALWVFVIISFSRELGTKPKTVLVAILATFTFPLMFLAEYLLESGHALPIDKYDQFLKIGLLTGCAIVAPLIVFVIYYKHVVDTAENEKENYDLISSQPYLICKEHHTRTKSYTSLSYKGVKCRVGKKCLARHNITKAVQLVGLIGLIENGQAVGNDYYVTVWDHRFHKIRYGDYDVLEIHENSGIRNFDYIISFVITFFNNEVDRYKPLNEVAVRIVGRPQISENTKRVLEKNFMKVEYLNS